MSLPYFKQFGWDAHVLAIQPDCIEGGVKDPYLSKTVPSDIPVTYAKALPVRHTRRIGLGSLGLRSFPYLLQAGDRLLQQHKFDLVFFSSTVFTSMALGPRWKKKFGVPYVLDFQDPWLSDYYKQPGAGSPPGGRLKYGFSQFQAKRLEPKAVTQSSHIISVSPAYPKTLQQRYPALDSDRFTVLPFGAPETDFELLRSLQIKQKIFDPNDGKRHWVYVGRGGADMALAVRSLFSGIQVARQQNPEQWQSVQLHFVGTSYAPKELAAKTVEPIAKEFGIADLVDEYPYRIPYFEALQVLADSDAILLIGSNDASYTASKLYPCVLAQKPIFALFHQQSSVLPILKACKAGNAVAFSESSQPDTLLSEVTTQIEWLLSLPRRYQPDINWPAFEPYTAIEMTRKQCMVFDRSLTSHQSGGM